jgi:hypothetical protein
VTVNRAVLAAVDTPSDGTDNRDHRGLVVRKRRDGPFLQMLRLDDDDVMSYGRLLLLSLSFCFALSWSSIDLNMRGGSVSAKMES